MDRHEQRSRKIREELEKPEPNEYVLADYIGGDVHSERSRTEDKVGNTMKAVCLITVRLYKKGVLSLEEAEEILNR